MKNRMMGNVLPQKRFLDHPDEDPPTNTPPYTQTFHRIQSIREEERPVVAGVLATEIIKK